MDNPLLDEDNILDDEFGEKIIKTRELTVLEQEYFDKARKKHKENIFKEQVVQGKVFKGVAFIPKPAEINFKDFDIGRPHSFQMQLTNVSFTFNSFKVLPLKESIRDFFEIMFTPAGRISAGMSCPIKIRFTPQLNDDINEKLMIHSETGPIEIPLICTSKKAIARCENTIIDFGKVIFGEDHQTNIKVQNHGALETEVIIKSQKGNDIMTHTDASSLASGKQNIKINDDEDRQLLDQYLTQLKFQKIYQLSGYTVLNIPMKYIPNAIGLFELPLMLYFENFIHSPPINIIIRGECIEVPIYVEQQVYDFQICLYSHVYREKIVFFNRSSNAMKIQIVSPPETKQFFEFNPKLGFIQGKSKFEIWVKFKADRDLTNMCQNFMKNDVIEIPFKLVGADQKMPVQFTIRAHMTTSSLQITPGKIDFGKIFEGQASKHQISFENLSDLPQELIIYPLIKEIQISMDLIPIRLLPKQKFSTDLLFRSQKVIGLDNDRSEDGYLKCKIITGTIATKEIRVPYCCEILRCPLEFSALKIEMPALQIDESHSTTLEIKNLTQREIIFEFFLPYPELCGLEMAPMVQLISRDNSCQVNIEYKSFFKKLGAYTMQEIKEKYDNDVNKNFELRLKVKYEEESKRKREDEENKKEEELVRQGKSTKKLDKKEVKKETKPQQLTKAQQQQLEQEQQRQAELEKQKEEEERIKGEELERNFNSQRELQKLGGQLKEFGVEGAQDYSQHYSWLIPCYFKYSDMPDIAKQVIYIQMETVSVQKSLILNKTMIDFEEIAVGIRTIKEIRITNNSAFEAEMKMDLLPISCGFTILNALRTIQPGQFKSLVVQFQPREEQPFEETLKLYCAYGCVSAKLKGKGVRPEVKVSPENGLINFGGVVLGEYSDKTFKITNRSNFAIKFTLLSKSSGSQNLNGTEVFSFIPSEAIVAAREEQIVKLIFKPDRISDKFYELISIDVPNQKDEKRLFIWGSCFNRQAYVNLHTPYLSVPTHLIKKIESPFDILKIKDEEKIYSPANNKIILEFSKLKENADPQSEQCYIRRIVVGSCRLLDVKLEKPCNFEIIMPKDEKGLYFVCDNLKGTVVAGNETIITFTFKPPQIDQFIASIEALQQIGQWKEAKAELKLSGGFIKANQTDICNLELYLRAFVNQI